VTPLSHELVAAALSDANAGYRDRLEALRNYRNTLLVLSIVLAGAALMVPVAADALGVNYAPVEVSERADDANDSGADDASEGEDAAADPSGSGAEANQSADAALSSTSPNGDWHAYAAIAGWGAFGGLLGLLVALRRLRRPEGPFGVQVAQAILRVPAGAFTAVVVTVIVQAELISQIDPIPSDRLGAYAVLFGVAQEAATRLIDRRAAELVEAVDPSGT
jgi:hypothetical protein